MAVEPQEQRMDYLLLVVVLALAALGLVMVLSSSSFVAQERFDDPYHFFRPQVMYVLVGVVVMLIARQVPYMVLIRLAYPMLILTILGLVVVLLPGMGHKVGGASRWIRLPFFNIQPSEVAKLTMVVYLAYSLAAKNDRIEQFSVGLLPHLLVLGLLVILVVVEPDLGSAVILGAISFCLFFVAGVPLKYMFGLGFLTIPAIAYMIIQSPFRLKRMAAFAAPWDDPLGAGYHIIHSFLAFASGGLTGLGPGAGRQKQLFLPEPHTDFIFSVVGEELGFVGVVVVAALFLVLIWRGLRAAMNAYDLQGSYLALGLTLLIGLQAFMNMSVVLGLLPTKGLALPFFSYGGSAMLVNFAAIGILLNVSGPRRVKG